MAIISSVVALLLLLTSCSSVPPAEIDLPLPPPPAGVSWSRDGRDMPLSVIRLDPGPEHCEAQAFHLLTLGWPPGRRAAMAHEARQFVRDPGGAFPGQVLGEFIPSTVLPDDAAFTGYRHGRDELWLAPSTLDAVAYLVRGPVVEQWPRAAELYGCA
jgi:hypothetical protein